MNRLYIDLSSEVFEALRAAASEYDLSHESMVARALADWLTMHCFIEFEDGMDEASETAGEG